MPDPKEIQTIPIENELRECPDCGYALGFHTSFLRTGTGQDSPVRSTRQVYRVILICPECGARFDAGLRLPLCEFDPNVVKAVTRAGSCVPHGNPADCIPALPPARGKRRPE